MVSPSLSSSVSSGGRFRLALVAMPWSLFNRPSVQLGALKSFLAPEKWLAVETLHPYLQVARKLGTDLYHRISLDSWLSEACYSPLLFPEQRHAAARLAARRNRRSQESGPRTPLAFPHILTQLEDQLETWLHRHDWASYQLVGFSVCFNQLLASLTAAAGIKRICPELPIVFGGSSCAGAGGRSLLCFDQVDYVVPGEGEIPLKQLCQHLAGQREEPPQGVISRSHPSEATTCNEPVQVRDLNTLDCPDYDGYFNELSHSFSDQPFIPVLPLEFSRGCWWRKCAFCNLNLQWRGYRGKKADTVAKEISLLASRHRSLDFSFTDNALPPGEARRLFRKLGQGTRDLRFFAEIRATTDPDDLTLFRRGGLATVQVGIEALSASLLARINKGVTVIDNIAIMKNAQEEGIVLEGNLITEFPGSSAAEVAETLAALEFVLPFRPLTVAAFFLGHGSEVERTPRAFGIRAVVTHPHNRALFPKKVLDRLDLLIREYRGDRQLQRQQWRPVVAQVARWHRFHARRRGKTAPPLSFRDGGDFLIIRQELPGRATLHHRLQGVSRAIYLACDRPCSLKTLQERFPAISREQLTGFLNQLAGKRLLFREGDRCLALAVRNRIDGRTSS